MCKTAKKSILFPLLCILTLFFAIACESSSARSKQPINLTKESQRMHEKAEYLSSAQHYLGLSQNSHPAQSLEYQIMAADMFVKAGEPTKAASLLDKVSDSALDVNQKIFKQMVLVELALARYNPKQAETLLQNIPHQANLPEATRSRVLFLQARTYEANDNYLAAARARSILDELLVDQQSQRINRQAIRQILNKVPEHVLNQALQREQYPLAPWLSLAYIEKSISNPAQREQAIYQWQQQFPNHPAQAFLSQNLNYPQYQMAANNTQAQQYYVAASGMSPRKIALLLPMNGPHAKAAKAIREGYLAAYYDNASGQKPSIQVYDTTLENDVIRTYQRAVNEGADFVVGPLVKEEVIRLSQMPTYALKTPILTLNEHPQVHSNIRSFVQFSLSPENEADQITEKARSLGYRNASIVVPNNSWGKRLSARFRDSWQKKGGRIVSEAQIEPYKDTAKQIRDLLAIEQSQKRSDTIKYLIKEHVEYQVRRRTDVDVVFMALPSAQARQIKPLFDFYYAHDLPILATSSVYAGNPNSNRDRDMNGIQFIDMPWVVNAKQSRVKKLINKQEDSLSGESSRLFAMGVDAYDLTQSFNQLQQSPNAMIDGATGQLSLNADNRIQRKMTWVKIANGSPVLVQ
ncbi:penicillin-binding protein activator [Candidatus Berkiella cookevillensis]|uniref:Penicillin-binding protein activator n=1 Tax=Candidatus Berkiella cookevillensis TaxID=437022 RepID=A0A0Q9YCQ0_9GAMM|nr:penicillin-binding protein activator [Candidatus Berkiella cookevillensis]MCS5708128.1 penicillin-binding protein activator [Candidatus Berkiella cookevillensis]